MAPSWIRMEKKFKQNVPFHRMSLDDQIIEIVYVRFTEQLKPVYMALNRAYPLEEQKKNPKVEYLYKEAHKQATQHRNFYKRNVKDGILPWAKMHKHREVYDYSQDQSTTDFRQLVGEQLRMLKIRLVNYAPMLVPADDVESLISTLEAVFEREHDILLNKPSFTTPEGIANYEAEPRYESEQEFMEASQAR